ncbi:UPF0280 family protein [Labrenzia sp. CE80]|uniref:UPF0280 family protein n=1 Tax=Labrenzia sp. CE80 TaxID=1788986 RepID=UPI0025701BB7|nr:UPF0280 family protein [Labrenzia sp. CE80]
MSALRQHSDQRASWRPAAAMLPDGERLHLQHGPIDLIIGATGAPEDIRLAFEQARDAFGSVLTDLVEELPGLKSPNAARPKGAVARRMYDATRVYRSEFITPMAAVAGSVADHMLAQLIKGRDLTRAYVNNGGDIALHLEEDSFRIGICDDPVNGTAGGVIDIRPDDEVGGIATSGWRGRSHSLGIADAVTVLASTAAAADAAATMIANAVDLPRSQKIRRAPANSLSPDSDLGDRLVTMDVGRLSPAEINKALGTGFDKAESLRRSGVIKAAYLSLAGERRTSSAQTQQSEISRNVAHA